MNNSALYSLIMLAAGLGIPTMAALNSHLGAKLQSPPLAATILLLVGALAALVYLLFTEGVPSSLVSRNTPVYFYLGGLFIAFYILTITWIAPRFGIANAISFVLLGQLIAMTIIDHFGLFGMGQASLGLRRLTGLVFMLAGVFMVLQKPVT